MTNQAELVRTGVTTPELTLNDGRSIPQLGFGTYKIKQDDAADAVRKAVEVGYRLVDTAAIYENERGVGEGLAEHQDIFLTTKIWNDSQGHDRTLKAADKCLARLGQDSVDLLLLHWPCPAKGLFVESWQALIALRDAGKAKSIGVSNFRIEDLERLRAETGVIPAVNQIELHPAFQQRELRAWHDAHEVVTECWSPLGQGDGMKDAVIAAIAAETGQPASAVILRWHLQHGLLPIPQASSRDHMQDNLAAIAFTLSEEQMARIDALDDASGRIGPDPADFS